MTALLINKSNITIILYDIFSKIATGLLSVIRTVQMYNIANHKVITINEQSEFWAMRETCINLGRITSYVLLLAVGVQGNINGLNILMVILTLAIVLLGIKLSNQKVIEDET